MRISVCVGNYAEIPYCVPGPEMNVYCLEELCYVFRENAFLLDMSLMEDALPNWIDRQCGQKELAKALYPMIHRKGSLSAFVSEILRYVRFYDEQAVIETENALRQGAGMSGIEKKKKQMDYLVRQKRYSAAIRGYDLLIEKWQEQGEDDLLPAVGCLAAIWHNKGVALAAVMSYEEAAGCFLKAYETDGSRPEYYRDYLAAKRMELPESEYVSFAAGQTEGYEQTLELEKEMERLMDEWEQQPEYLRINRHRELRESGRMQQYYEENESMAQALKESYRRAVG